MRTRTDLVRFLRLMEKDFSGDPNLWEIKGIPSFLDALSGLLEDMDGYYANNGEECPSEGTWNALAAALCEARAYE